VKGSKRKNFKVFNFSKQIKEVLSLKVGDFIGILFERRTMF